MTVLLAAYAALLGLVVGSFLNVVIYRLPRGLSPVRPRSRCPRCGTPIRAQDNVPLLSWLLLRGRCRACSAPISWRYPAVEAATAALFVASTLRFGATLSAAAACTFVAWLLALALIDVEHLLLPNKLTYPGIVVGLLWSPFVAWTDLLSSAIAAVAGAGVLLALIGIWYAVRHQLAMGFGDPKMLAMIGAFLGLPRTALTLFLASLVGALVGLGLLALGHADLQSKLPFGLYLAIGGTIALFFGSELIGAYAALL